MSSTTPLHQILKEKFQNIPGGERLQFPPNIFKISEGELLSYDNSHIEMLYAVKKEFNNPFGITFGGIFSIWFDATFGPFSTLISDAPTTSLDLNVNFIKSVSPADKSVIVKAEVISKSKTFINMEGKMYNHKGDLVATGTSRMMILDMSRM